MNAQTKFPSKGISGKRYLLLWTILMVVIFAAAQIFLAPKAVVTKTFEVIPGWIGEYLIRMIFIGVLVLARAYITFTHVLDTPLKQLKAKFEKSRNDSHAIVLIGLAILAYILITAVKGVGFTQYLYIVMTRGALGEIVGDVITILVARFCFGIHSMDEFRDWVDAEDNNSHAILVMGIKIISLAVALAV